VSKRTETKTIYVCDVCGMEQKENEVTLDPDASAEVVYHGVHIVVSGPFSAVKRVVDECRKVEG
jgi:hypothetical protein